MPSKAEHGFAKTEGSTRPGAPFSAASPGAFPTAGDASTILLAENGFVGDSIVDGPGLRCTIFVQGCPHACPGCHNPGTHPFAGGQPTTPQALLEKIQQYPLCRAVTLSGGEPFCQAEGLAALAALLRAQGYGLAAYSGYTFEQLLCGTAAQRALLEQLDTLVDGPFTLAQRDLTLRFRGSANQRILNVKDSLARGEAVWEAETRWTGA